VEVWKQRTTFRSIVLTWSLPLIGPATQLWQVSVPAGWMPSPAWTRSAAILSISYSFSILATAFLVKRGLMLAATGRDAYYARFVRGSGGYAEEKQILSALGLEIREFPLDTVLIIGGSLLLLFMFPTQLDLFNRLMNSNPPRTNIQLTSLAIGELTLITVAVISLMRRKKLSRA
jgi:hypothetical protein